MIPPIAERTSKEKLNIAETKKLTEQMIEWPERKVSQAKYLELPIEVLMTGENETCWRTETRSTKIIV